MLNQDFAPDTQKYHAAEYIKIDARFPAETMTKIYAGSGKKESNNPQGQHLLLRG